MWSKHTPRLDIQGDNGLGGELGLGLLLLPVLGQALIAETCSLGIFLLVVGAEQVDIIIIIGGGSRGLGGVQGELRGVRAVCGVRLAGIAVEGGELILESGNVLVPAGGLGVLGGIGRRLESLEAGDVGLRGSVAIAGSN